VILTDSDRGGRPDVAFGASCGNLGAGLVQSIRCPGGFIANCHCRVTLAVAHFGLLAPIVAQGLLDPVLNLFSARRFDVPAAA